MVYDYTYHSATEFDVSVKEDLDKLPTLYWLPKLHTRSYKSRLIAKSSSCTTTKLSKCLTSCFTVTRKDVIKYCDKFYDRSGKNLFSSIKNSNEVLNKMKPRSASSLFRYIFPRFTLHCLIKGKLNDLIDWTFRRVGSLYLACNGRNAFSLPRNYTSWSC